MKIRLSAIGSEEFLALLHLGMTEFEADIELIPYLYETPEQLLSLIEHHRSTGDIWVVSEQVNEVLTAYNKQSISIYVPPTDSPAQLPSQSLLRLFLKNLKYEEQIKRLQQSQIAIQIVQVANFNRLMDQDSTLFYDVYRLYLRTQELLLSYTECVFGSFVSIGNGRFMIFSTRGIMENNLAAATLLLHQIQSLTHLSANIGMGYGNTALEAEKNARLALNYAERAASVNCIYSVDENGSVRGPLQNQKEMSFKYRTDSPDLMHKLSAAKVSIATYEKLLSVQHASNQNSITASTVSERLHMSDRNARKILASLQSNGLAEIVGQEIPTSKGRPRQIFRILE